MSTELPSLPGLSGVSQPSDTSQDVSRTYKVPTVGENVSLINVREVEDWCKETREHRTPVITSTNALGLSLGLLVGFLPAMAATDRETHAGWWGIFLFGTILAVIGCAISLLVMFVPVVVNLPKLRNMIGRKRRLSPLERLAERMERACENGQMRAEAAEQALQQKEERAAS